MVIVTLEVYGNFDIPVVHSVWYNESFQTFNETGLSKNYEHPLDDTTEAEKDLKRNGFNKAKYNRVTVGGEK